MSDEGEDHGGEGGSKPQGPIPVTDLLISAPALAEHGRHIDPFALPHWRYLEVWTWVATRDFGQVSGMRRWCNDPRPDASGFAGLIMATIDRVRPVPNAKAEDAFAELDSALANGDLQALGRKNGGDLIAMPREVWAKGRITDGDGGTWWEGTPLLSPFWTDIRIPHIDVKRRFDCNSTNPPIRAPGGEPWVALTASLMWIEFQHAADIDELNGPPLSMLGLSHEHVRLLLERAWHKLSNAASEGRLKVRGRLHDGSVTERDERDLTRDELLNCKWFDWALGDQDNEIVGAVFRFKPDDDIAQMHGGMVNFSFVRVEREGLLRFWPVPAASTSMGAALSQQMVLADHARIGELMPLMEACERVAKDWAGSAQCFAVAEMVDETIIDRMRDLLRSKAVRAYVCESDGKHWRIPSAYWGSFHDYIPLAGSGFFADTSNGELALRLKGCGVHVSSVDLDAALKAGTVQVVTTGAAIKGLKEWLAATLDSASPDTLTRREIEAEARSRFQVSANAFRSTWQQVTADGRTQWNRGGRKPRR